jgi:hypothetical protein
VQGCHRVGHHPWSSDLSRWQTLRRDVGRAKLGARLRGWQICLRLVRFGPPRPDLVECAKNGSPLVSTQAASHCAAAEDGCGGAWAITCLGISGFTSTVAADLGMYADGQIKMKAAINGVIVQQLVGNGSTTKFRRR